MKVVFLDRDGVINEFPGDGKYVTRVKDFHFIPGSLEALRLLKEYGYTLFVISNQAGVGKGIYSKDKLNQINRKMIKGVNETGGRIRRVFYCTHRSDAGCDCRKPGIGSLVRALRIMDKTIHAASKAFFIGDTEVDIMAGHNAGCKTIFVLSGREDRRKLRKWKARPDFIAKNLLEATHIINHENSNHTRLRRRRS